MTVKVEEEVNIAERRPGQKKPQRRGDGGADRAQGGIRIHYDRTYSAGMCRKSTPRHETHRKTRPEDESRSCRAFGRPVLSAVEGLRPGSSRGTNDWSAVRRILVLVVVLHPALRVFRIFITPLGNQIEELIGGVHHVDPPRVAGVGVENIAP